MSRRVPKFRRHACAKCGHESLWTDAEDERMLIVALIRRLAGGAAGHALTVLADAIERGEHLENPE